MGHQVLIHEHPQHRLLLIGIEEGFSRSAELLEEGILFKNVYSHLLKKNRSFFCYLHTQLMQFFISGCLEFTFSLFEDLPFTLVEVLGYRFPLYLSFCFFSNKLRIGIVLLDRFEQESSSTFDFPLCLALF